MKKIRYRKLIRDKVPQKLKSLGVAFETRTLNRKDFRHELLKKAGEECSALPHIMSRTEMIAELADVHDVLEEIRKEFGVTPKQIVAARKENSKKKGGFRKRVFLEWSEDNGYKTNERMGR